MEPDSKYFLETLHLFQMIYNQIPKAGVIILKTGRQTRHRPDMTWRPHAPKYPGASSHPD